MMIDRNSLVATAFERSTRGRRKHCGPSEVESSFASTIAVGLRAASHGSRAADAAPAARCTKPNVDRATHVPRGCARTGTWCIRNRSSRIVRPMDGVVLQPLQHVSPPVQHFVADVIELRPRPLGGHVGSGRVPYQTAAAALVISSSTWVGRVANEA
jgi:hypothetical protein